MKQAKSKRSRRSGGKLTKRRLSQRTEAARENSLHALADMRRNPNLSASRAARAHGVKLQTIKKHYPSALRKSRGKLRVTRSDRFRHTLNLPDAQGKAQPFSTRSSAERTQASRYLRDLGRYLRGNRHALDPWRGKSIAGFELVTDAQTIESIEPALSDFSLYRSFNGGAA